MKKIALVVGHRKSNQGAYGNMGISEFEYYSKFVEVLATKINELNQMIKGVEVKVFYRQDKNGYSTNMREQHKRIDDWGADIDIEFHFNGSSNPKVQGHEVLYASKKGKKVATIINDTFNKHLNTNNRGIKKRTDGRGSYGLTVGKSVSVIVEPFFSSHQDRYVEGTKGYGQLMQSFIEAITQLSNN